MGTGQQGHASAWHDRADDLTRWTSERLVNRVDAWGAYGTDGVFTAPAVKDRGKKFLTIDIIRQHFRATHRRHVIGTHAGSVGPDSMAKWIAGDIDAHTDTADTAANWRAAQHWHGKAIDYGLKPLLIDSNGKGGYHLRVLFASTIPLKVAHFFAHWLFDAEGGLLEVEIFPKQERLTASGDGMYGNWLRLPGRHHSREHWSRIWDGSAWLSGTDAIDYLLTFQGDDPARILDAYTATQAEADEERRHTSRWTTTASPNAHTAYGAAALRRQCGRVQSAANGTLHHTLCSAAASIGRLIPDYLTWDEAEHGLYAAAEVAGGKDMGKALKTIQEQLRFGMKNPARPQDKTGGTSTSKSTSTSGTAAPPKAPPPPYKPFPVELLPSTLAAYVTEAAAAIGCDPAYVALPALAAAASLVGNTRSVMLKRSWFEPAIVWTVIIGESGTLKSPGRSAAVDPLLDIERRLQREYVQAHAEYLAEFAAWKDTPRGERGQEPSPPTPKRCTLSNCTIEAAASVLSHNPRGILMQADELATWLGSFSRYKGKAGGTDMQHWLEAHGGRNWIIDRKTGEPKTIFIPHATISVTGGIQPAILAGAMTGEHWSSGFGARLLLAWPPRRAKVWTEAEINPDTAAAYSSLLETLHNLEFREHNGEKIPHHLHLDEEAKKIWIEFYNQWGRKQADVQGDTAAAFSKLEGYAARLALVHHVVDCAARGVSDLSPITAASVTAGIGLVHWFAAEDVRVYALLAESEEEGIARRLAEMIRVRGGHITARELQRGPGKYPTADAAEAALDDLVAAGFGAWRVDQVGARGGRPSNRFWLHTDTDKTDKTPHDQDEHTTPAHDTTPPAETGNAVFSTNNEVVSVLSVSVTEKAEEKPPPAENPAGEVVSPNGEEVSPNGQAKKSRRRVIS